MAMHLDKQALLERLKKIIDEIIPKEGDLSQARTIVDIRHFPFEVMLYENLVLQHKAELKRILEHLPEFWFKGEFFRQHPPSIHNVEVEFDDYKGNYATKLWAIGIFLELWTNPNP